MVDAAGGRPLGAAGAATAATATHAARSLEATVMATRLSRARPAGEHVSRWRDDYPKPISASRCARYSPAVRLGYFAVPPVRATQLGSGVRSTSERAWTKHGIENRSLVESPGLTT